MNKNFAAPSDLGRIQSLVIGVGLLGLVGWVIGVFTSGQAREMFFHTYLVAYVFWIGIALGCLGWLMIQYLGGATWGLVIRRILESGAHTLFLMALLFVPILIGLRDIYQWTNVDGIANEQLRELVAKKTAWLNPGFFTLRAVIYFVILLTLTYVLRRLSHRLDETGDPKNIQSAQNWSGPGFLIYGLVCTFAAIDWVMSLDPEWYSSLFGLLMIAGQGVASMALIISVSVVLAAREPMNHVLKPKHFHDFGKLLMALVCVWAYFSFSQLLIIWSGNLPEEIPWYLERFKGPWRYIGLLLIGLHFMLPFFLLLSRDLKKNSRRLVLVAWLIIIMRLVDLFWLIVPSIENDHQQHVSPLSYPVYILAAIGLGGVWLGWFFWQLRQRDLISHCDPLFDEAISDGGHH
ncbi:MAG: hypothetical protein EBU88_06680 [Acidobacteria bacterium]|nr:hypothetical protein [Acidobacteriota bacterium]